MPRIRLCLQVPVPPVLALHLSGGTGMDCWHTLPFDSAGPLFCRVFPPFKGVLCRG